MKKSLKIALILIVAIFIVLKIFKPESADGIEYELVSPEKKDIENVLLLSGFIVPDKSVLVKSHVSGIIENIYIEEGQVLKKGDRIASIRLKPDPLALEQANNVLNLGKLELSNAQEIYERSKPLYDQNILPKIEMKKIEQNVKVAEEKLVSAKRQYEILLKGFSSNSSYVDNDIIATTEGTVIGIKLKIGAWVNASNNYSPGDVICEIADLKDLKFQGQVEENFVSKLKLKMPVRINVSALSEKSFGSEIRHIDFDGLEENGIVKFGIECNIDGNNDIVMRSGYSASAEVTLESIENVISLPESVIRRSNIEGKDYVLSYTKQKVDTIYIKTGISDGIYTQILSNISLKDKFIK